MDFLSNIVDKYQAQVLGFARRYYIEARFLGIAIFAFVMTTPDADNTLFLSLLSFVTLSLYLYPELTGEDQDRTMLPRWLVVLAGGLAMVIGTLQLLTNFDDMGLILWVYTLTALLGSSFVFICLASIGQKKISKKS